MLRRTHFPRTLKGNISVPLGVNNVYGSTQEIIFYPPYYMAFVEGMHIVVGGTFGTGETVTTKITLVYDDGTTSYTEKDATAAGTMIFSETELYNLILSDKRLIKIQFNAKTNLASTSVTVMVNPRGWYV